VFFFFQAEDGIRDFHVTGVQTCALPILSSLYSISIMDKGVLNKNFTAKQLELAINLVVVGLILHFILSNISSWAALITVMYFTVKLLFFYTNIFFVTPILLKEKKTGKYVLFVLCLFVLYVLDRKSTRLNSS